MKLITQRIQMKSLIKAIILASVLIPVTSVADTCPDGSVIPSMDITLTQITNALGKHFKTPVEVTSGFRCPSKNKAVGGSSKSKHLTGEALDIVVPGVHPSIVADWLEMTYPNKYGIGRYNGHTHIDTRPHAYRWGSVHMPDPVVEAPVAVTATQPATISKISLDIPTEVVDNVTTETNNQPQRVDDMKITSGKRNVGKSIKISSKGDIISSVLGTPYILSQSIREARYETATSTGFSLIKFFILLVIVTPAVAATVFLTLGMNGAPMGITTISVPMIAIAGLIASTIMGFRKTDTVVATLTLVNNNIVTLSGKTKDFTNSQVFWK